MKDGEKYILRTNQYFQNGENYFINGKYDKALEYFNKSLEIEQSDDCLNYVGCCHLWLNNLDVAENIFKKLIKSSPCWGRPFFNLGRVYLKKGKLNNALKCFKKAVSLSPNWDDIYFYYGVCYYKLENYEKAKECYEKSLSINNSSAEAHQNLGMCYLKLKIYEKAVEEFDLAYHFDSDCKDAIRNKGLAFMAMKQYVEALNNFLTFNEFELADLDNMFDIAFCYFRIKDLEKSYCWLNKLIMLEPNYENANSLLEHIKALQEKQV